MGMQLLGVVMPRRQSAFSSILQMAGGGPFRSLRLQNSILVHKKCSSLSLVTDIHWGEFAPLATAYLARCRTLSYRKREILSDRTPVRTTYS